MSQGHGDHGGASYGSYQLSSKTGTLRAYLLQSGYGRFFKGLTPGDGAFDAEWIRLALDEPGFEADQHEYIKKTHYDIQVARLAASGLDVATRGAAIQDMTWSMAVQYRGLTPEIVDRGLRERFGTDYDVAKLTDVQIIDAVHDTKLRHVQRDFGRSSDRTQDNIETRIETERRALTHLANYGEPLAVASIAKIQASVGSLGMKSSGSRVVALQTSLKDLGYLKSDGDPIAVDGAFGPGTEQAVRAFQATIGVRNSGVAGPALQLALSEQLDGRQRGIEMLREASQPAPVCRLDNPIHPDNDNFLRTRMLVHQLDHEYGKAPDTRSDNLSAALVVSARSDGLHRIDEIELSEDASYLWGTERTSGVRVKQTQVRVVESLNTPVDRSSARWPEAMQEFDKRELQKMREQTRVHEPNDPRHPDNPENLLYNELQRCVPDASDHRLLQFTAACHQNGITAENLNFVHLDEENLKLYFNGTDPLTTVATVDLNHPPPQAHEAIQQIQQFDQQEAQLAQEFQERSLQRGQRGPSL